MTESIFKKYLESLVEKEDDVVVPDVKNTFVGEVVEEKVIDVRGKGIAEVREGDTREKVNQDIDALLKKMLPQFGKMEEESLDKHNVTLQEATHGEYPSPQLAAQSPHLIEEYNNPLHKKSTTPPPRSSILDALSKKPDDIKAIKTKGLEGVEYEEYDPSKIQFMPSFPRHELKHKDHSSLIIAKQCLRKHFYANVINLVIAEETNIFYPWGTSYHIYRQRLNEHYGYGDNEPKTLNVGEATRSHKLAQREAIEYWMKNGEDQKPGTKYDWFTTERLAKSFAKAFEHWLAEKRKGQIKVIAVEQFFTVALPDGSFIQGRIDEAVLYNGELWGRDFKTTSKPENWFIKGMVPNNQVRTYTYGNGKLAGRPAKGIIIQAMYNGKSTKKEDKGPLVYEKLIEVSNYELTQWEKEQIHWNRILEQCREYDIWPQSEVNCGFCDYQMVCAKPTEASMVYVLETKFKHRLRDPARVDIAE